MSNLSEFSKNLEKYGLRKTKVDKKPDMTSFYPGLKDVIMWEHDDMDQSQAMVLVQDFYDNFFKSFRCTGFNAVSGFIEYKTNNIEDIINYSEYNDGSENMNKFIENYKYKKLSWKL
jgi:hypothetical protein